MSRVRAFFIEEATECLAAARAELAKPTPSPTGLHAAFRQLRGSAQLARYGEAARIAEALERRLKPIARGRQDWSEGHRDAARRTTEALDALLTAIDAGDVDPDERAETEMDTQPMSEDTDAVEVAELEYRGVAALDRALDLRPALEDAIVAEEPVGPLIEELFDLIRLART